MITSLLNKKISINTGATSTNKFQNEIIYSKYIDCWSQVIYIKGDQLILNEAVKNQEIIQFIIRFRSNIMFLNYIEIEYLNNIYEVKAKEVIGLNEMIKLTTEKNVRKYNES
jgi:hypothetical protein